MPLPYSTSANLPYGSRILSINSLPYIANRFRVEMSGDVKRRKTEVGAPNGAFMLRQPYTGTAELQIANTAVAFPNVSLEFSAFVPQENANLNFFLSAVGAPEEQDNWKFCDITFEEKI